MTATQRRAGAALVVAAVVCVLAGCLSRPPDPTPKAIVSTQSYTLPWLHSPDLSKLSRTLEVSASVNGGAESAFIVDTGSVGVVVPAAEVPNIPSDSPSGSLIYNSSGLKLTGVWATLPVSFPHAVNATGATATARATVPVLAVTEAHCIGHGVNSPRCRSSIPHMLGVGFGRGTTAETSPAYNPFLNLDEMVAGTMRRGYVIGSGGLSLGLTESNTDGAWEMQSLRDAGPPAAGTHHDWMTPTGGYTLGAGAALSGKVLIDTGLLNMIIEDPSLPSRGEVADGTPITVAVGKSELPLQHRRRRTADADQGELRPPGTWNVHQHRATGIGQLRLAVRRGRRHVRAARQGLKSGLGLAETAKPAKPTKTAKTAEGIRLVARAKRTNRAGRTGVPIAVNGIVRIRIISK